MVFYYRLKKIREFLNIEHERGALCAPLQNLLQILSKAQRVEQAQMEPLEQRVAIFEELRAIMRIAPPQASDGLNNQGDNVDMNIMEQKLIKFNEKYEPLADQQIVFAKMIKQIKKYWEKLFATPILVNTPNGQVRIQPQRTNNIMEQLFRYLKQGFRKRSGNAALTKTFRGILSDTPLVKNLSHPDYLKLILNGKSTLAERFSEIDIEQVRRELKEKKVQEGLIPSAMKKQLRSPQFIENFLLGLETTAA